MNDLDLRIPKNWILKTSLFGFIIFCAFAFNTKFPYMMDEYYYLLKSSVVDANMWETFKSFAGFRPIYYVLNSYFFQSGLIAYSKFWIIIYFFIHALSFTYLASWMIENLKLKVPNQIQVNKTTLFLFSLAVIPFLLHPGHNEILYWTLQLPCSLGLPLIVLGLHFRNIILKVIFFALSMAALETYVFPILGFLTLPIVWDWLEKSNHRETIVKLSKAFLIFFISYFLFQGLQVFINTKVGNPLGVPNFFPITLDQLKGRFNLLTGFLWNVHFYKTYWVHTGIQWLVFLVVTGCLYYKKVLNFKQILILFVFPFFCGAQNLLLHYYAPRAVYGALEFRNFILCFLFLLFLKVFPIKKAIFAPLLILIVYLSFTAFIFEIKTNNSKALAETESVIVKKLKDCDSPCNLSFPSPNQGIHGDWMMSPDFHGYYIQWKINTVAPNKQIDYQVVE